jgi:hypothetical protein
MPQILNLSDGWKASALEARAVTAANTDMIGHKFKHVEGRMVEVFKKARLSPVNPNFPDGIDEYAVDRRKRRAATTPSSHTTLESLTLTSQTIKVSP